MTEIKVAQVERDPVDVTNLLKLNYWIEQNGETIEPGSTINHNEQLAVFFEFNIPVLGDGINENNVNKGDYAEFVITNDFNLLGNTTVELFTENNIKVGTVTFTENEQGFVVASVVFDGVDSVYNGDSSNVKAKFNGWLLYDKEGDNANPGDHTVLILEKTYGVTIPSPADSIVMSKKDKRSLKMGK